MAAGATMSSTRPDKNLVMEAKDTIQVGVCAYENCRTEFTMTRKWQRFCCQKCKNEHWRLLRKEVMEEILKRKQV
jgi:hypothetical protein